MIGMGIWALDTFTHTYIHETKIETRERKMNGRSNFNRDFKYETKRIYKLHNKYIVTTRQKEHMNSVNTEQNVCTVSILNTNVQYNF